MKRTASWRAALLMVLVVFSTAGRSAARPRSEEEPSPLRERGVEVRMALLIEYYRRLPERKDDEEPETWAARLQEALAGFKQEVSARYSEGTLQRVLAMPHNEARRAAVVALGLMGTMQSNKAIAVKLHDSDGQVRQYAADALWAIWFRGDSDANVQELQRLMRMRNPEKAVEAFGALIKKAPEFAEAYNQRAILHFRLEEYQKSIADCEVALKLNPAHFGAAAGMAQCYMKLKKPRAALKAFKHALKINPNMEGVEETIRSLEDVLGEENKPDDKK
ncbi:MAG: tetratricopeptide repeat protein [Gemmataceae bacterium]|nr:tetratricopeptide repeat protein [Gemmataceae bacterium]